jgi:predicted nucleic acid-binding protein
VPAHFLDSSALVKHYVQERGSDWVRQTIAESARIYVCALARVEVVAAITRKGRADELDENDARRAMALFENDWKRPAYEIVEVTPPLLDNAAKLVRQHALRAYDAVQLAAAVGVAEKLREQHPRLLLVFVSADEQLNHGARAEHLVVDNPNNYE